MASIHVHLKHNETESTKKVPVGFSWTVFFFGPFPPLFRGDLSWAVLLFLGGIGAVSILGPFVPVFTVGMGFFYNQKFLDNQLDDGYRITGIENGDTDDLTSWMKMTNREDLEEKIVD